jgi:two-component system OmpR family sensor kinase
MKLPELGLSRLEVPRLGLASFRRRILIRGVFLLLALATLALAVVLLQDEKERSYLAYQQGFRKTQAEVMARLRHPAGLLALLNPAVAGEVTPLRPLLLPYAALDFDDQNKAQQAVEMAGCSVRYPDGSSLCVAIGNNPYAGGFIYLVGRFAVGELVARERGELDLDAVHRARIRLSMRGQTLRWVAPFERLSSPESPLVRGRLTGFEDNGEPTLPSSAKPLRDFRGWLWQSGRCADAGDTSAGCLRNAFFSIRLPVEAFREALFSTSQPVWPPADLDQIRVELQLLGPHSEQPLFDSNAIGAMAPPSLEDLRQSLLPGETLTITPLGRQRREPLVLKGGDDSEEPASPLIMRLIRRLPVTELVGPVQAKEVLATPVGRFDVLLAGDARGIDRGLSVIATRMSWYVAAMLGAIALAWLVIEVGLIRRITQLTKRAAAVSHNVQKDARGDARIGQLDVSDLRGSDELGILAGGLADLLQRVKDDVQREQLRAAQERDMLQAVGHEILSPLQSLMVLHPAEDDPGHRYVQRMQQAVRVLYGQASPSEALAAAELDLGTLDLDEFLHHVAANAHFAGIEDVQYARLERPVPVRADAFSLEDVVTHILRNADRHRTPGTPIVLALEADDAQARVRIRNQGPPIPDDLLPKVFDYGVSDAPADDAQGRRGQGLFVARTYMAKMGGTIAASNEPDGVSFVLELPRPA